jgi:hypothetical protein
MIPYGRHEITDDDIQSVVNVLKSDFITQGSMVPAFEKKVSDYCTANFAVAVNSERQPFTSPVSHWDCNKGIGCGQAPSPLWLRQIVRFTVGPVLILWISILKPAISRLVSWNKN